MTPSTVFSMTMCELQGLAACCSDLVPCRPERERERERQGARDVTKCSVKTCSRLTAARCRAQGQPSRLSPREARRLQTKKQSGLESRAVAGLWTGQWAGQCAGHVQSASIRNINGEQLACQLLTTASGPETASYFTQNFPSLCSLGDREWWMSCQEIAPLLQLSAALMWVWHKNSRTSQSWRNALLL